MVADCLRTRSFRRIPHVRSERQRVARGLGQVQLVAVGPVVGTRTEDGDAAHDGGVRVEVCAHVRPDEAPGDQVARPEVPVVREDPSDARDTPRVGVAVRVRDSHEGGLVPADVGVDVRGADRTVHRGVEVVRVRLARLDDLGGVERDDDQVLVGGDAVGAVGQPRDLEVAGAVPDLADDVGRGEVMALAQVELEVEDISSRGIHIDRLNGKGDAAEGAGPSVVSRDREAEQAVLRPVHDVGRETRENLVDVQTGLANRVDVDLIAVLDADAIAQGEPVSSVVLGELEVRQAQPELLAGEPLSVALHGGDISADRQEDILPVQHGAGQVHGAETTRQ